MTLHAPSPWRFSAADQPLRMEPFGLERLEQHARALGQKLIPRENIVDDGSFLRRTRENARLLRHANRVVGQLARSGEPLEPDAEWLLDNFYIVEEQLREIHDDLPESFFRELPQVGSGQPRVHALAVDLIGHTDSVLDEETIVRFITEFQTDQPLTIGELWAFPIMLRLVLVENLRRIASQLLACHACRAEAARALSAWKANPEQMPELSPFHECQGLVLRLLEALEDEAPTHADRLRELERRLATHNSTPAEIIHRENQRQAANQVSIGNVITSMRLISALDWVSFFERTSHVDRILRRDPTGVYSRMDLESRDRYRHVIERVAKGSKVPEVEVARTVMQLANDAPGYADATNKQRHVGFWLIDAGLPRLEGNFRFYPKLAYRVERAMKRFPLAVYLGSVVGFTAIFVVLFAVAVAAEVVSWPWILCLSILAAIPVSEFAVGLTNLLITCLLPPRLLPKLDFTGGVPDDCRTVVVVPSMLTSEREVASLLERIEMHYLSGPDPNLSFALLTDFSDAPQEVMPADAALIEQARAGIDALNEKYTSVSGQGPFHLFHRRRQWNSGERVWMGWERKRGKLLEFHRLLNGAEDTTYSMIIGDFAALRPAAGGQRIAYILTLDSDTQMPHGAARRLIGTIAHPLNRPVYDPAAHRFTAGYSLLQPRVSVNLASANSTRFARLFSNHPGIDPYVTCASDVYQDLFGEGSFTGKGIYDFETFSEALDEAFPENQILSHDLIEGCHTRVGLVSDIELFDNYPPRYEADARRQHRWVRGDWQILPWLLPVVPSRHGWRANCLSVLSRWKIFDNLRRSLVPPLLMALLLVGWIWTPAAAPWYTLAAMLILGFPLLSQLVLGLVSGTPRGMSSAEKGRLLLRDVTKSLQQWIFALAVLPHRGWSMFDAIARTLCRMCVTRRRMLEWETASDVERRLAKSRWAPFVQIWYVPLLTVLLPFLLPWPALVFALPLLLAWFAAPFISAWTAQPPRQQRREALSTLHRQQLRLEARRIWSFFEAYVNDDGHWLPPDNVQEYPHEKIAFRTSPTNEGLYLVSALVAHEFGYLALGSLIDRWEKNLNSWESLDRFQGHFLNWYETSNLKALYPRYVSTVDSGNLLACFLTVRQAIDDLMASPRKEEVVLQGLADSAAMIIAEAQRLEIDQIGKPAKKWSPIGAALEVWVQGTNAENLWPRLKELEQTLAAAVPDFLDTLEPENEQEKFGLKLKHLLDWLGAEQAEHLQTSAEQAVERNRRLQAIAERLDRLASEMSFGFLFNPQRRLFSIGYNLEDGTLDRSHYDLLCSEARLASYLAIARGDVEAKHWFRLGRQMTLTASGSTLLSWGGTMFEYLMPCLFQRQYAESLLTQSCLGAIARQQEYGRQRSVPWGISESAFGALAINSDYHYRSFGVPGLGLKRGLSKDLVISPYSSFLAVEFDPVGVLANLKHLEEQGGLGQFGYFEALDYTPERLPIGKRSIAVKCFMAHHQGMSLLALGNTLLGESVRRRFHSHPLVRSTELLLQEKTPVTTPTFQPHPDEEQEVATTRVSDEFVSRRIRGVEAEMPLTHLLSNGEYSVCLSHTGTGFSQCGDVAVSRWRPDAARDVWGQFIYIRNVRSGAVWSPTYQPTRIVPDSYEVVYSIDKADFHRVDGAIETLLEVSVSPENQAELRQLKITNHGEEEVDLELTSYLEVALAEPRADAAHPAFQKLFIETEYISEETALLAKRRPRESKQSPQWAVHVMTAGAHGEVSYETSRAVFLGRNRTVHSPAVIAENRPLSNSVGAVLDPIFSLRTRVTVPPAQSVTIGFATAFAKSRDEAIALADQYHDARGVQRGFELAWAYAQVELRHLHISPARMHLYQKLGSKLLYPDAGLRASAETIAANRQGQRALWRYGISGDLPILLVHVTDPDQLDFVRDLIKAQSYLRGRGLRADLVIQNDYPGSYIDELQDQLVNLIQERQAVESKLAGVFLLRGAQLQPDDRTLLDAVATVVLSGELGDLQEQMEVAVEAEFDTETLEADEVDATPPLQQRGPRMIRPLAKSAPAVAMNYRFSSGIPVEQLEFWNGTGGFAHDGKEYHIRLAAGQATPMPWSNVIANERFGTLLTETGGGYTWFENSRENKLTTWANDPLSDPPSEWLLLADATTGEVLSPLAGCLRDGGEYWVQHGQGYSRFLHASHKLAQEVLVTVAPDDPVKFVTLKIKNLSSRPRSLSALYVAEWVLGVDRQQTGLHLITSVDEKSGALLAHNAYHPDLPGAFAFLQTLSPDRAWTCDRQEIFSSEPASGLKFNGQTELTEKCGAGLDACGGLQAKFQLQPGEEKEVVFLLGAGFNLTEVQDLLQRYSTPDAVAKACRQTKRHWETTLATIEIKTPNRALDLIVNRWLLYQTLSCRVLGRSAYYQSGGAYGFRDQLQDVMALLYSRPELARQQILRAAARQFEEGDVQHWWHPPEGRGTRTRFSDDLLWLPFVVCRYLTVTGDASVLDEIVSYLHSPVLNDREQERYELPTISAKKGTLYEHCLGTLRRSLRVGPHGLPLMGCGDWNDGMNMVGHAGQGESVWMGWFLVVIIDRFAPLVRSRGEETFAIELENHAEALRNSLEMSGWDGGWYRRAYFDDGTPLGSSLNDECQIDSIAQSWAVLAGAPEEHSRPAIEAVLKKLVNWEERLVLLFAPPFDKSELEPGYIKGYLPGIRENGGQYTHPALWLIEALTKLGDGARAMQIFDLINPIHHSDSPDEVRKYQVEPYVVAADVYGVPPHVGRGGWTWYTGSAAWMYRAALESILGLRWTAAGVNFEPCLPPDWNGFEIKLCRNGVEERYQIQRDANGKLSVQLDDHDRVGEPPAPNEPGTEDLETSPPAAASAFQF